MVASFCSSQWFKYWHKIIALSNYILQLFLITTFFSRPSLGWTRFPSRWWQQMWNAVDYRICQPRCFAKEFVLWSVQAQSSLTNRANYHSGQLLQNVLCFCILWCIVGRCRRRSGAHPPRGISVHEGAPYPGWNRSRERPRKNPNHSLSFNALTENFRRWKYMYPRPVVPRAVLEYFLDFLTSFFDP